MELMRELKGRGIQMAIVSNKIDAGVKALNEKFFAEFVANEVAIGEREGVARKPAPDTIFEVLKTLQIEPNHAIYVGDSEVDIVTAENADLRCVSVSWGFREENFLMESGAGVIINRPLKLLEYL